MLNRDVPFVRLPFLARGLSSSDDEGYIFFFEGEVGEVRETAVWGSWGSRRSEVKESGGG